MPYVPSLLIYNGERCRRPSRSLYKSLIIRVGERKFHVTLAHGIESSRERKFHVIFAPGNEVPWSESTWERKFHNSGSLSLFPKPRPSRRPSRVDLWPTPMQLIKMCNITIIKSAQISCKLANEFTDFES